MAFSIPASLTFDLLLLLILESQYFTIGLVYDPLSVWTFYDVSVTWVNKG